MFVDSSVIVAILANEADAAGYVNKMEAAVCTTSALVILESTMRLSTLLKIDPLDVEQRVQRLLDQAGITLVPLDRRMAGLAVKAFAEYGKGRGHPAQLNLADCLSYACAKAQNVSLLCKGKDFSHTDLA